MVLTRLCRESIVPGRIQWLVAESGPADPTPGLLPAFSCGDLSQQLGKKRRRRVVGCHVELVCSTSFPRTTPF